MSSATLPPRALSPGKEALAKQWYRYANVIPPQENLCIPRVAVLHGRQIDQLDAFVAFITKQQASNQIEEVTLHTSSLNPFQLQWISWIL